MAGLYQPSLVSGGRGKQLNSQTLRDYAHASKTFLTDNYGNSPKFKFLFHVYFDINKTVIDASGGQSFPEDAIPGLLVKNISLPKFTSTLVEMNQYNRKRYVQTKITYDPVTIAFHDDRNNSTRNLWYNYYRYYYNDPNTASADTTAVKINNIYGENLDAGANWGYNGDVSPSPYADNPKPNFFNTIKIYGLYQHNYCLYTLINPIIDRWEHDTYDYYQNNGVMENRMTVRYETVIYQEGETDGTIPDGVVDGFGLDAYYDRERSPITPKGGNKLAPGRDGLVNPQGGSQRNTGNNAGTYAQRASQNNGTNRSSTSNQKVTNPRLTARNNKILDGTRGISNTAPSSRGLFNIPSPGSSAGGSADMYASSENVEYTQAPPVDDQSNFLDGF